MRAIDFLAGLGVGTVETVAPDSFTILLDTDAPQTTALNTGTPTAFPRINSYVLIPTQVGAIVGQIAWLGVERSSFPKRKGLKDFGLIDLPFPLRKMRVVPIGMLTGAPGGPGRNTELALHRGVTAFPSVGDPVVIPTADQLRAIVESTGSDRRVPIGRSPLADDAVIGVDPDKLFGRHTAVLGNTGSGKSCTVAGLIRWSLESARKQTASGGAPRANARFVVLDPNGEYCNVFADLVEEYRVFRVVPDAPAAPPGREERLRLPAWVWNSQEWFAFTEASPRAQQPVLLQALRELRSGYSPAVTPEIRAVSRSNRYRMAIAAAIASGPERLSKWPGNKDCAGLLGRMCEDLRRSAAECSESEMATAIKAVDRETRELLALRVKSRPGRDFDYGAFGLNELERVVELLDTVLACGPGEGAGTPLVNPDAPVEFPVAMLPAHLQLIAEQDHSSGANQYISYLTVRIRSMLSDSRVQSIIDPEDELGMVEVLEGYLGSSDNQNGSITVIDLSLVPSDVVHLVVSVIGRVIFEALQRHRRRHGDLPTTLVLEEAHSFIQKGTDDPGGLPNATQLCRRTFERIAREGRKFGLGLVLSSQRPSELSETVLSQCNSFLLHRLVNDRDQDYVRRLVPDLHSELLKDLPSLPSQHAILLGWASPIPKLVRIDDLPRDHRPASDDPKFWNVWTGVEGRSGMWGDVVAEWTGEAISDTGTETDPNVLRVESVGDLHTAPVDVEPVIPKL